MLISYRQTDLTDIIPSSKLGRKLLTFRADSIRVPNVGTGARMGVAASPAEEGVQKLDLKGGRSVEEALRYVSVAKYVESAEESSKSAF